MAQKLVEATHITKLFSGVAAIEEVDFDLERGEVHALMGEMAPESLRSPKLLQGSILRMAEN